MPIAWSAKDERKYEHIKESAKERGTSTDRAEMIAARTVKKARREEGRTRNKRSQVPAIQIAHSKIEQSSSFATSPLTGR